MAASQIPSHLHDEEAVTPYTMHVSSRYLDLTHQKLQLTRLPRELDLPDSHRWAQGTPKSVLEPLLDFWLEGYDWRKAELGSKLHCLSFGLVLLSLILLL